MQFDGMFCLYHFPRIISFRMEPHPRKTMILKSHWYFVKIATDVLVGVFALRNAIMTLVQGCVDWHWLLALKSSGIACKAEHNTWRPRVRCRLTSRRNLYTASQATWSCATVAITANGLRPYNIALVAGTILREQCNSRYRFLSSIMTDNRSVILKLLAVTTMLRDSFEKNCRGHSRSSRCEIVECVF